MSVARDWIVHMHVSRMRDKDLGEAFRKKKGLLKVRKDGNSDRRRKTHATTEPTAGQSQRTVHLSPSN